MLDKILKLLESDEWPAAVDPSSIADENNDVDCFDRAEYILKDVLKINLRGKKVLDFGCGAGHVVAMCLGRDIEAFGYDIEHPKNKLWEEHSFNLTRNWAQVLSNGPYDFVLMHDVFDHSVSPLNDLYRIKTILKPGGAAFIRFHPICSRHGGHIHKRFNKAFAHMVLNDKELTELGLKLPPQRALYPIKYYEAHIHKALLKKVSYQSITTPVEPFFEKNPITFERLNAFYGAHKNNMIPGFQMMQTYVDYLVTRE